MKTAVFAATLLAAPLPAMASDPPSRSALQQLRVLYLASVETATAIPRARAEIETLRSVIAPPPGSELDAVLTAYDGALTTLQAKHALWPPQKLRYLRAGLATLDRVVEERPDEAEVRYLRLMSCVYLPGLFGRSGSVREDVTALARLLPTVRAGYEPELYQAIAAFVLEQRVLSEPERRALENSVSE